jgi:hypothetical protein
MGIDEMLRARAAGNFNAPPPPAPPPAPTAGQRFMQGAGDLTTGLGQIAEHLPFGEPVLNGVRSALRWELNKVGAPEAAALFAPVSTGGFDDIVHQRESDYQNARQAAGQTGIDWWRLGGQSANPLNYAMPGGISASVGGRIMQAGAQGAAIGAAQPSVAPGSFWWDKAKGATIGGVAGAGTAGVIEGAMPLIRAGINAVRRVSNTGASPLAASTVVHSALNAKGIDPETVDLNVLSGMRQEAQDALDAGVEPSAAMIAARAQAESLPVPVRLMKGQASGDPMQFSKEQNLRGIVGVGEPLTTRLQEQNAAFIQNLDALGAKNAPDTVSTGTSIADKVQGFWDGLQKQKNDLYGAVRNSRGQPAMMDQFTAARQIRDELDTPAASHAYDLLPANIQRTIGDLEDGKLPLTVAQMQALDKTWGEAARGTDGSTAYAINTARRILGNAPVQDDVGEEARQAYMAARQAHAQQMSLIDPKLQNGLPNPQFQPLVKAVVVDGKPAEGLFQTHFMGAAPSVAGKNLAFLSKLDPTAPQQIGQTLMGEIKRTALSSASDERGTVSQSVLNSWAGDPVKAARMEALLPEPAVQTYRNLAATVENAKRFPVAATVNTSNTGSAVVNAAASAMKEGIVSKVAKSLPFVNRVADTVAQARKETAVQGALSPGVTLQSLLTATPIQQARRSLAARLATPAAVAAGTNATTNE